MKNFKKITYRGVNLEVSSHGRIFKDEHELLQNENNDGYCVVSLKTTDGWRQVRVNRLVALAFILNDDSEKTEVNHKDFNRRNNNVDNLEWVTHKENVLYSRNAGRYPSQSGEQNSNYGNKKLSKKYKDDPILSKEKQSRPGVQNGRCRKTDLYYKGKLIKTFPYYKLCCEYLMDVFSFKSTSYISNLFDKYSKTGQEYKGYSVVKH